jgi:hypothetical protein
MTCAAIFALASSAAFAVPHDVDPETLPAVKCSDLVYSQAFLAKYPKAPAACLDARIYKGHRFMKVKGKVYIADKNSMTVNFQNVAGDPLDTGARLRPS